ncbi:hypothetical protein FACS189465_1970 [Clostridia bacterium]|nr:hypothetical protein FACS189465_1970 [Clostridia bacterium]
MLDPYFSEKKIANMPYWVFYDELNTEIIITYHKFNQSLFMID